MDRDAAPSGTTSESGGVLGRVGAGVGEAADGCDSGCGADNGSVLGRKRAKNRWIRSSSGEQNCSNRRVMPKADLFGSACSCLLAHPVPSLGTSETLGSLPLFSAFRLGRLAGGGMRRAEATLPRDCRPWRGGTGNKTRSAARFNPTHTSLTYFYQASGSG